MNRNGAELTRNNKFKPRLVTPQIAETATKLSRFRAAANELRADLAQARDARERARNQIRAEIENAAIAEPAIWERLYRVGRWVQAKIGDPQAMLDCKGYGLPIVLRAAGDAVNSAGGVLVPDEIADMIIALRDPRGSFRAAATVLPMGSDVKNAPRRTGGMTAFFTSENAALTESSSETWDNVGLTAKKITAFAKISAELGEDAAIDVGVYFLAEVSYAFATLEDSCGWNGDGTSTFAGIRGVTKLLTDGSHNAGKVAAATGHNTFLTLDNTDLANLMAAAPAYALPGAKWFVSQFGYATTFCRLAASAGGIVNTANGPEFLGFPVQRVQVLPQTSATQTGSVMIAFGDLSQAAVLGDRRELRLKFLTERFADTDQIGIIGTERVDIVAHSLGDNTTAGPVVGLVGTA